MPKQISSQEARKLLTVLPPVDCVCSYTKDGVALDKKGVAIPVEFLVSHVYMRDTFGTSVQTLEDAEKYIQQHDGWITLNHTTLGYLVTVPFGPAYMATAPE